MKYLSLSLVVLLLAGAAFSTGCSSRTVKGAQNVSVLGGAIEYHGASFAPPGPISFNYENYKTSPASDLSGKEVSLLWGLVNYTDY